MRTITSLFHLALTALTIAALSPLLLGTHMTRNKRTRREHIRLSSRLLHLWARVATRGLGIRVVVKGRSSARPSGPVFFTSNHMGYMDIVILASVQPFTFVSKKEAGTWPVLGPMIRAAGTLFVDRENRGETAAFAELTAQWLRDGADIVIFPEGTSANGERVLPFKSSLFAVPVKVGAVVQPLTINYISWGGRPFSRKIRDNICWYGDMTLAPHLWNLFSRRGLVVEVIFAEAIPPGLDRKALAAEAHRRVSDAFSPCPED
ncbi:MAG: lysophospholipid acyltransferase family protein [Pseudomonadota bacterium]